MILYIGISNQTQAQNLIIDQISQSVEVKRENLDQAKKEALAKGKRRLVENAMARFLDDDSMVILKNVFEQHILKDTDRLIDSIRVIEEETSEDRKEFKIVLEGRIFRSRLMMALRPLGLMHQSKRFPPRKARLIYVTDLQFSTASEINFFRSELQKRLKPYWIEIGSLVKWERSL
ncbi:MAG: hypothetical protein VXX76_03640, partial [SAR324 cluster bacterium]|nr:hypothetical protein [SAR324 cluster bacterium]